MNVNKESKMLTVGSSGGNMSIVYKIILTFGMFEIFIMLAQNR